MFGLSPCPPFKHRRERERPGPKVWPSIFASADRRTNAGGGGTFIVIRYVLCSSGGGGDRGRGQKKKKAKSHGPCLTNIHISSGCSARATHLYMGCALFPILSLCLLCLCCLRRVAKLLNNQPPTQMGCRNRMSRKCSARARATKLKSRGARRELFARARNLAQPYSWLADCHCGGASSGSDDGSSAAGVAQPAAAREAPNAIAAACGSPLLFLSPLSKPVGRSVGAGSHCVGWWWPGAVWRLLATERQWRRPGHCCCRCFGLPLIAGSLNTPRLLFLSSPLLGWCRANRGREGRGGPKAKLWTRRASHESDFHSHSRAQLECWRRRLERGLPASEKSHYRLINVSVRSD